MNFMNQPSTQTLAATVDSHLHLLWRLNKESQLKLSLEIYSNEDVIVVSCKGRIVYGDETATLSGKVEELLPRARQLVLELSQVDTIDGAGIGELLVLFGLARAHNCIMKLAAPSPRVRGLLELTNLHTVFEIYPTLGDAILSSRSQVA
jgi:anti-sigma B factor antagonist